MDDLRPVISKNIADLRRSMNWTQADLAQKLNYSDKAVSKWERAESVPDVAVLKDIADLFSVKLDFLLQEEHSETGEPLRPVPDHSRRNHIIIALLSAMFVYLAATFAFVVFELVPVRLNQPAWMLYFYAIPVSCVVLLVFNSIWGRRKLNYVIISALVWTILLAVYLSYISRNLWLIFMIGIPAQIIILLSANFKFSKFKGK